VTMRLAQQRGVKLVKTTATDFMDDFKARGGVIRDGSDLPRLGRAEKIMKLAVAYGVPPAL